MFLSKILKKEIKLKLKLFKFFWKITLNTFDHKIVGLERFDTMKSVWKWIFHLFRPKEFIDVDEDESMDRNKSNNIDDMMPPSESEEDEEEQEEQE